MFKELKEGQTNYDPIIEIAERIVIDYANLSERESANRAKFRERVIKNLKDFVSFNNDDETIKQEINTRLWYALGDIEPDDESMKRAVESIYNLFAPKDNN